MLSLLPHGVRLSLLCATAGLGLGLGLAGAAAAATAPPQAGGVTTQHHAPPAAQPTAPSPALWCAGHRLGTLSPAARRTGQNLARLRAAQAELAPGFASGSATTGVDLLAAYQEELEKSRPDRAAAASYLAVASAVPITLARVRDVNALLCVSTTAAAARAIATEAEAERLQMSR